MFSVSYLQTVIAISVVWIFIRSVCTVHRKSFDVRREVRLLLVYASLLLVVRFTFFPFTRADGQIQPLLFDRRRIFPLWLNFEPLIHLFDYPSAFNAIHNFLGNTLLFIPVGIVWPAVFKKLNTHAKVICAGIGLSVCIELLQLPFYVRATDVDDLILNSTGYLLGYAIYLKGMKRKPTAK